MKSKYVCHSLISLIVNFHDNWSNVNTNFTYEILQVGRGRKRAMWLYAVPFVSCKFNVDAFSLLYSKLLRAKLCVFVFGANFAASH